MTPVARHPFLLTAILLIALGGTLPVATFHLLRTQTGEVRDLPFRDSPPLEQWAAVLTGFVVKPLYTLVALILVILLWRRRAPEMVALKWALLCFFVGENFCAANYLVYGDRCILYEYLHSFGMTLCFGLTTYALIEGSDRYLIQHGDPQARCAGLSLCLRCIKHTDVPCGFQRLFLFVIPAILLVALMPLCMALIPVAYNTRIWGTLYTYAHPVVYQIFEQRYLPVAAVVLLAVSWMALRFKQKDAVPWAKVFFAAGAGALGFSFLRLVLFHGYRDNLVWFGAWEEITELLFVLGVALVLWLFRKAFILAESSHGTETSRRPRAGETNDANPQL